MWRIVLEYLRTYQVPLWAEVQGPSLTILVYTAVPFGDKPLKFRVVRPLIGTTALKGSTINMKSERFLHSHTEWYELNRGRRS